MSVVISSLEDAKALEGKEVGLSDWIVIDQDRINKFAEATDDHQWIHTDPERAEREFPLGSTIAHGYLTISLIPALIEGVVEIENLERLINYGINKVRFRSMVPSGSKVRGRVSVVTAKQRAGSIQMVLKIEIEMEGEKRPVATAEIIVMYFLKD